MQCSAKSKQSGNQCKRAAAVGKTVCAFHGAKAGAPIKTGRYSLKHRASLEAKAKTFLESPSPGDLTGELAMNRALLQDFLDRFPEGAPLPLNAIQSIFEMTESIGRTVERIAKILNQTALTQAEVQFLRAQLVELVVKYIDEPERRLAFAAELESAFGSGGRGGQLRAPIGESGNRAQE